MWNIWKVELRMSVRQTSYYMFLLFWVAVLSLLFLLQRNAAALTEYTNMAGTIMNVILYIIPLFMTIIGSFSIANEKENGQWRLLCTYPLDSFSYVLGKMGGQFTSQIIVFTFSYGLSLCVGLLMGGSFVVHWILALYLFSIALMYFFLLIGMLVGSIITTRWQALTVSVIIWFFFIMIWPTALIGILGLVPYTWIAILLKIALFANPAELLRMVMVVKLDGGSVFGQSYDSIVQLFHSTSAIWILLLYVLVFTVVCIMISTLILERKKRQ